MVPAAAFAEAEEAVELDEVAIELEADATDAFNGGYVSTITVTADKAITPKDATAKDKPASFALGENTEAVISPTKLTLGNTTEINLGATIDPDQYEVALYEGAEAAGTPLAGNKVTGPGVYTMVITAKAAPYTGGVIKLKINVSTKEFDDVKAFDVDKKGAIKDKDTANESPYSAEPVMLGFATAVDGTGLLKSDEYTVTYVKKGDPMSSATATAPTEVGTYTAVLAGQGAYKGAEKLIDFQIKPLDLSDKDTKIITEDVIGASTSGINPVIKSVNGSEALAKLVKIDSSLGFTGPSVWGQAGAYTNVKVVPANASDTNFAPEAAKRVGTTSFNVVASTVEWLYNGAAWPFSGDEITINTTKGESFDLTKVTAKAGELTFANAKATATEGKVSFAGKGTLADGTKATIDGSTTTLDEGEYEITFTATPSTSDPTAADYVAASGSKTVKVKVTAGELDAEPNAYIQADGKDTNYSKGIELVYDSKKTLAERVTVKSFANLPDKKTVKDVKLSFKDADGKDAKDMKDAGTYTAEISLPGYDMKNNTFTVTIKPIEVTELRITNYDKAITNNSNALPYDSDLKTDGIQAYEFVSSPKSPAVNSPLDKEGAPVFVVDKSAKPVVPYEFILEAGYDADLDGKVTDKPGDAKHEYDEAADPTKLTELGNFNIVIKKDGAEVKEIKDKGTYEITLAPKKGMEKNYAFTGKAVTVTIVGELTFVDVAEDSWSAEYVADVDSNGWMKGYDATHFGPKDNMKRGDVALVLWRMATGEYKAADGAVDNQKGVDTGFSDVPSGKYYAQAIKWAADAGIVTGYSGKDAGKFGPEDPVSREQFVLMMSRYAAYQNVATASDGKAMAEKKDPAKVSSWAKDAVAWGVDEGMIGSNGTINPQGKIQRQEIAKMVSVFAKAHVGAAKATPGK